jgi:hypothetical protein
MALARRDFPLPELPRMMISRESSEPMSVEAAELMPIVEA